MNRRPVRPIEVFIVDDLVHVRVDAPGERAVSQPVPDVLALIKLLADTAGFEVDAAEGELYISWPAG